MYMIKSLKGLIAVVLILFCLNITSYSQSIILNKTGDTLLVFTLPQSKFLLKESFRAEKLQFELDVHEKQMAILRDILENKENVIDKKDSLYQNEKLLLDSCVQDKSSLEHDVLQLKSEIKKQKIQKNVIITLSIILLTLTSLKL